MLSVDVLHRRDFIADYVLEIARYYTGSSQYDKEARYCKRD